MFVLHNGTSESITLWLKTSNLLPVFKLFLLRGQLANTCPSCARGSGFKSRGRAEWNSPSVVRPIGKL